MEVDFIDPNKKFYFCGKTVSINKKNRSVNDFWRWGYSDLIQNINRGILAEYLIAWVLSIDEKPRNPWDAYDLMTGDGFKIEVKSTGYLQAWDYGTKPNPRFVIQERQRWTDKGLEKEAAFNADVYILCYHKEKDRIKIDPMDLSQWDFWVFSKKEIIQLLDKRKSISINQILKEGYKPLIFNELRNSVEIIKKSF